jgi:hypothetical protein
MYTVREPRLMSVPMLTDENGGVQILLYFSFGQFNVHCTTLELITSHSINALEPGWTACGSGIGLEYERLHLLSRMYLDEVSSKGPGKKVSKSSSDRVNIVFCYP